MSRALVVLSSKHRRQQAAALMMNAPIGTRVEVKGPKRTLPQNDRMWALLTAIASQTEWAGKKRTPKQWKELLTGAFQSERKRLEIVPGLDGGFMVLGLSTSDFGKEEMAEFQTYIEAWAAGQGISLAEDEAA